jgi:hypothetical protein
MEKASTSIWMVIIFKDIFIKDIDKVKVNISGMMVVAIKESGNVIKCMDMVSIQLVRMLFFKAGSTMMFMLRMI